jgi:hypothetical protein
VLARVALAHVERRLALLAARVARDQLREGRGGFRQLLLAVEHGRAQVSDVVVEARVARDEFQQAAHLVGGRGLDFRGRRLAPSASTLLSVARAAGGTGRRLVSRLLGFLAEHPRIIDAPRREVGEHRLRARAAFERRERFELVGGREAAGPRAAARRARVKLAAGFVAGAREVFAEKRARAFEFAPLRGLVRAPPERVHLFRQLLPALPAPLPFLIILFRANVLRLLARAEGQRREAAEVPLVEPAVEAHRLRRSHPAAADGDGRADEEERDRADDGRARARAKTPRATESDG